VTITLSLLVLRMLGVEMFLLLLVNNTFDLAKKKKHSSRALLNTAKLPIMVVPVKINLYHQNFKLRIKIISYNLKIKRLECMNQEIHLIIA
jgi:hypothetical protein